KVREVAEQFIMVNQKDNLDIQSSTFKYISAYIISGSIEVMKVWLENNMDTSPKEIASLITYLTEGYSNKKKVKGTVLQSNIRYNINKKLSFNISFYYIRISK